MHINSPFVATAITAFFASRVQAAPAGSLLAREVIPPPVERNIVLNGRGEPTPCTFAASSKGSVECEVYGSIRKAVTAKCDKVVKPADKARMAALKAKNLAAAKPAAPGPAQVKPATQPPAGTKTEVKAPVQGKSNAKAPAVGDNSAGHAIFKGGVGSVEHIEDVDDYALFIVQVCPSACGRAPPADAECMD